MSQPLRLVETSPNLPARADVVVIGGGIIGVFTAYYLARRGMKVALVEKGRIGAEQSSRNWGWCRQQNRDARELPMATKEPRPLGAIRRRERRGHRLQSLRPAVSQRRRSEIAGWARWGEFARDGRREDADADGREASERGQATGSAWKGGVFSPTDGTADPSRAAPAVAARS